MQVEVLLQVLHPVIWLEQMTQVLLEPTVNPEAQVVQAVAELQVRQLARGPPHDKQLVELFRKYPALQVVQVVLVQVLH